MRNSLYLRLQHFSSLVRCEIGWLDVDCSKPGMLSYCFLPDCSYGMHWTYDSTRIYVQLHSTSSGWLGVMLNSDNMVRQACLTLV